MGPAIFRFRPQWESQFAHVGLIVKPTPVQRLEMWESFGAKSVYAKREDLTDSLYGGNKVRNCEFILGDALARGKKRVTTVAPLGSNFLAALAAQAKRVGVSVEVEHFVPVKTPQILAHAQFSKKVGAKMRLYSGRRGAVPAALVSWAKSTAQGIPFVSPGGSHPLGVLGHVSALLELAEQVGQGLLPVPDVIVVGVGTCGTLAGLLIAKALLKWNTKIIAVRCVDKLVCHRRKVASLVAATLKKLNLNLTVGDFAMVDVGSRYGVPLPHWENFHERFFESDRIYLDTTYTGKVVSHLDDEMRRGSFDGKHVLYWHTFSPNAVLQPWQRMALEKVLPIRLEEKYSHCHVETDSFALRPVPHSKVEEWPGGNP